MSLDVLPSKLAISEARRELSEMGAPPLDGHLKSLGKKLHLLPGVEVGDIIKSWDVLRTVKFLNARLNRSDPVLDIGCYASEITSILFKLGYSNLAGADLNPNIVKMPHQNSIRYHVTDFMHTDFGDTSFAAITSISVIEHGFAPNPLLTEVTRLLRPNGYFVASFDYWPDKIDTTDTKFFDMDWKIFSREEVEEFVELAGTYGLRPVGEMIFDAKDRPIECGGRAYTFGWLALQKTMRG